MTQKVWHIDTGQTTKDEQHLENKMLEMPQQVWHIDTGQTNKDDKQHLENKMGEMPQQVWHIDTGQTTKDDKQRLDNKMGGNPQKISHSDTGQTTKDDKQHLENKMGEMILVGGFVTKWRPSSGPRRDRNACFQTQDQNHPKCLIQSTGILVWFSGSSRGM